MPVRRVSQDGGAVGGHGWGWGWGGEDGVCGMPWGEAHACEWTGRQGVV